MPVLRWLPFWASANLGKRAAPTHMKGEWGWKAGSPPERQHLNICSVDVTREVFWECILRTFLINVDKPSYNVAATQLEVPLFDHNTLILCFRGLHIKVGKHRSFLPVVKWSWLWILTMTQPSMSQERKIGQLLWVGGLVHSLPYESESPVLLYVTSSCMCKRLL